MIDYKQHFKILTQDFPSLVMSETPQGETTFEVAAQELCALCARLRDDEDLALSMLMDLCAVDYSQYGIDEWQTESATNQGFSRGVVAGGITKDSAPSAQRFAVVYHLLSIKHNARLRVRVFVEDNNQPVVPSVVNIWPNANWFEREAFDLFGVVFSDHPDLRRILTDYGFKGHPLRKDFPLIGEVEVIYDAEQAKVIYKPCSIEPRVLVPKVIRHDSRYLDDEGVS